MRYRVLKNNDIFSLFHTQLIDKSSNSLQLFHWGRDTYVVKTFVKEIATVLREIVEKHSATSFFSFLHVDRLSAPAFFHVQPFDGRVTSCRGLHSMLALPRKPSPTYRQHIAEVSPSIAECMSMSTCTTFQLSH